MKRFDLRTVRDFYASRAIVFLGPPYVGKKTQSVRVAKALSFPRIETSDLLNAAEEDRDNPYHLAARAQKCSRDGGTMNGDDLVNGLILRELERLTFGSSRQMLSGTVFDGACRSRNQVIFLERLRVEQVLPETIWIYLSARRHVLEERHERRMREQPRPDDGARESRFSIFENSTRGVIEWIRDSAFGHFIEIDAEANEEMVASLVDLYLGQLPNMGDTQPQMRSRRPLSTALGR